MQRGILGNLALSLKGDWQEGDYQRNDVVRHRGAVWGAVRGTSAQPGQGADWMLFIQGAGPALPLFTVTWSLTGLAEPGFLDISRSHGPLLREAFPEAWEKLAGFPSLISDSDWLAEAAAHGVCGKFSSGDGAATFRAPFIAGLELAAVEDGKHPGTYQPDQMRPITGHWAGFSAPAWAGPAGGYGGSGGAIDIGGTTFGWKQSLESGTSFQQTKFDSARLGLHFNGEDTHSRRVFAVPLLKIRE